MLTLEEMNEKDHPGDMLMVAQSLLLRLRYSDSSIKLFNITTFKFVIFDGINGQYACPAVCQQSLLIFPCARTKDQIKTTEIKNIYGKIKIYMYINVYILRLLQYGATYNE